MGVTADKTKQDLVNRVSFLLGYTKKDTDEFISTVFDEIAAILSDGKSINITGFGRFEVRERKERVGVDPNSSKRIQIPAGKNAAFVPSKKLKKWLSK